MEEGPLRVAMVYVLPAGALLRHPAASSKTRQTTGRNLLTIGGRIFTKLSISREKIILSRVYAFKCIVCKLYRLNQIQSKYSCPEK